MDSDDELNEPKYKNWVQGAKGLEYLQEGLQNFVGDKILSHRDQALQKVTSSLPQGSVTTCNQCTDQNLLPEHDVCIRNKRKIFQHHYSSCFGSKTKGRRKCPNDICSKLYDEIVDVHQFNNPLWRNTDPSTWCSDPTGWSYAKCFQTTLTSGTCSTETDAAGLLSVIINDKSFQSDVACILTSANNIFANARESRNAILHCAKLELEDIQLQDYLDTFIAVLQDPKYLLRDKDAKEAVQKLKKLKNKQITIGWKEENRLLKIRKDALVALEQLKKKENEAVDQIEDKTLEALDQIENAREEALEKIDLSDIYERLRHTDEKLEQTKAPNKKRPFNQEGETVIYRRDTHPPGKRTKFESSIAQEEEKRYIQVKTNLKRDLIELYRQQYATIQLSPLIEEEDASLLDFYVKPQIKSELKRVHGGGKQETKKVENFHDIFFKDKEDKNHYSEIYVTADAGLGKTAFSKRLALAWCQAKDRHQKIVHCFSQDEIGTMIGFDFVFLVLLRDSPTTCHIDDMIFSQLISQRLENDYSSSDLKRILSNERCLIVLDGLDEWSHPSNSCDLKEKYIPHRRVRGKSTVLTTSRPWKLAVSGIKASHIEQKLKLVGLYRTSAKQLQMSVISHVSGEKDESKIKQEIRQFDSEMKANKLSDLAAVPILLMYMLCLFCDKIGIGNSLLGLYCKIVEMLLKRSVKKYKDKSTHLPRLTGPRQSELPPCFRENKKCLKYFPLLVDLGKLAYETLLVETKEERMLVFDRSVAKKYLNNECLDFCLNAGLLTQTNCREKLLEQKIKVSFVHKTLQEFFAALYMYSAPDSASIPKTVTSKCKCLSDILEMSKMIVFISGFNAKVSSLISPKLMDIVNENEITSEYRRSADISFSSTHPLKQYQDLCVSCCKDMSPENKVSLCIQDVFIDDSCQQEQYRENLQHLTTRNKHNIRSVYINMYDMSETPYKGAGEIVDYFSLIDLKSAEKIYYTGNYDKDILPLLNKSIKCLNLSCGSDCSWTSSLGERVKCFQELEAMHIDSFKMSHRNLLELYNYIAHAHSLRQIVLKHLRCTDHHHNDCPGSELNLRERSKLTNITLNWIPVAELDVNSALLEKLELKNLSYPDFVFKFVNNVAADSQLTPETHVVLIGIAMSVTTFRELVDVMSNLQKQFEVEMWRCRIKPEDEFEMLKEEIKSLHQFTETEDASKFSFRIIKGGV